MNELLETKHILSYGAGVDSTALAIWLVENRLPFDYAVFADTGGELPATYDYLQEFKPWLEAHGVKFVIVKNKSETLYDRCMRRKVIPSEVWRWCTRDFKIKPIHRFYKTLKCDINQYIAIDFGEIQRMKDSKVDYITNLYPLIDNKFDRKKCVEIIKEAGFKVPIKSGCFYCPFHNRQQRQMMKAVYPAEFQQIITLERNGKHYPKQRIMRHDEVEQGCLDGYCMN